MSDGAALELLSRCKIRLRQRHPYFAVLTLFAIYRTDPGVDLADTDGRVVRLNADAFLALPDAVATGLLLHVTLHAALLHPLRLSVRNPELWNIACDVIVNHIITSQTAFPVPPGSYVAEHIGDGFVPQSAEQVYEYLLKHRLKAGHMAGKLGSTQAAGAPQGGSANASGTAAPDGAARAGQTRSGGLAAAMAKRFGAKAAPAQASAAPPPESAAAATSTAAASAAASAPAPAAPLRDIRAPGAANDRGKEALRLHWESALIKAREQAGARQRGSEPSTWLKELDAACQPQIDWRTLLWRFTIQTPTDFAGLDRRFVHAGLYLEALVQERVHVDVAIDTSGSIGEGELEQFASELRAIVASYPHIICNMYFCDTELYGPYEVTADFALPPAQGGGGTDFRPFFAALERRQGERQVDAAIYFTDGQGEFPATPPHYPVLWVALPGAIESDRFPFGQVIRMA
jgi:predicted metal-dependent peptidase